MSKKQVVIGQARKIIRNVYCYFQKQAEVDGTHNTKYILHRTYQATNIWKSTIKSIVRTAARNEGQLLTRGLKKSKSISITKVDEHSKAVIVRCIRNMQATGSSTTVNSLLAILKKEIGFKGSTTSLRRIIHDLGYRYNGKGSSRVLVKGSKVTMAQPVEVHLPPQDYQEQQDHQETHEQQEYQEQQEQQEYQEQQEQPLYIIQYPAETIVNVGNSSGFEYSGVIPGVTDDTNDFSDLISIVKVDGERIS